MNCVSNQCSKQTEQCVSFTSCSNFRKNDLIIFNFNSNFRSNTNNFSTVRSLNCNLVIFYFYFNSVRNFNRFFTNTWHFIFSFWYIMYFFQTFLPIMFGFCEKWIVRSEKFKSVLCTNINIVSVHTILTFLRSHRPFSKHQNCWTSGAATQLTKSKI